MLRPFTNPVEILEGGHSESADEVGAQYSLSADVRVERAMNGYLARVICCAKEVRVLDTDCLPRLGLRQNKVASHARSVRNLFRAPIPGRRCCQFAVKSDRNKSEARRKSLGSLEPTAGFEPATC